MNRRIRSGELVKGFARAGRRSDGRFCLGRIRRLRLLLLSRWCWMKGLSRIVHVGRLRAWAIGHRGIRIRRRGSTRGMVGIGRSLLAKARGAWMERAEQRGGLFGQRFRGGFPVQRAVAQVWRR